jgi:hypothetical protein
MVGLAHLRGQVPFASGKASPDADVDMNSPSPCWTEQSVRRESSFPLALRSTTVQRKTGRGSAEVS